MANNKGNGSGSGLQEIMSKINSLMDMYEKGKDRIGDLNFARTLRERRRNFIIHFDQLCELITEDCECAEMVLKMLPRLEGQLEEYILAHFGYVRKPRNEDDGMDVRIKAASKLITLVKNLNVISTARSFDYQTQTRLKIGRTKELGRKINQKIEFLHAFC